MSPVAIAMNVLLAALLLLALAMGARLNRRLKVLRDSQAGFAEAVVELNEAAGRAEAGLASLRAASEEAHDQLLARIETARSLATKLERATTEAQRAAEAIAAAPASISPPPASPRALGERASLIEGSAPSRAPSTPAAPAAPSRAAPARARPSFDDDLFEGGPAARASEPPLRSDTAAAPEPGRRWKGDR